MHFVGLYCIIKLQRKVQKKHKILQLFLSNFSLGAAQIRLRYRDFRQGHCFLGLNTNVCV